MANGAALARLPFDPPSTPIAATVGEPIENKVGIAVADACEAFGVALAEGGNPMRTETRRLNGERLAAVVELWLAHRDIDDFRALAQREGSRTLLARHAAGMRQGADIPEMAIARTFDELCSLVVTVAGQVAATEAAFRMN